MCSFAAIIVEPRVSSCVDLIPKRIIFTRGCGFCLRIFVFEVGIIVRLGGIELVTKSACFDFGGRVTEW